MMTYLADDIAMFSLLPFRKSLFHEMARRAILRVVLSVTVVFVSDNRAKYCNYENSSENKAPRFFNTLNE